MSPSPQPDPSNATPAKPVSTPLRCFGGALISGPAAIALYLFTTSIAHTFAEKPLPSNSTLAANIAVLVRTLVVGMTALGSGIFALTTLGLLALGIQLIFQRNTVNSSEPDSGNG
ncbi:MAG: DUF3082 domain-containing protein [Elainellaceae cyanobacterium]